MTLQCWNCGRSLDDVPRPISRHEHCRDCFEALHSCRLCRHYRTDVNSRCNEERADPPMNKENANFCDFFAQAFAGLDDLLLGFLARSSNDFGGLVRGAGFRLFDGQSEQIW